MALAKRGLSYESVSSRVRSYSEIYSQNVLLRTSFFVCLSVFFAFKLRFHPNVFFFSWLLSRGTDETKKTEMYFKTKNVNNKKINKTRSGA